MLIPADSRLLCIESTYSAQVQKSAPHIRMSLILAGKSLLLCFSSLNATLLTDARILLCDTNATLPRHTDLCDITESSLVVMLLTYPLLLVFATGVKAMPSLCKGGIHCAV
jgi:hypothetical protein